MRHVAVGLTPLLRQTADRNTTHFQDLVVCGHVTFTLAESGQLVLRIVNCVSIQVKLGIVSRYYALPSYSLSHVVSVVSNGYLKMLVREAARSDLVPSSLGIQKCSRNLL